MSPDDLKSRFTFHPPSTEQKRRNHEYIRDECHALATTINETVPDGREKSLAITHLEEVMFWANAAIARNPQV